MKSSFDGFHKPNTPQRLESSLQKGTFFHM